MIWVYALVLATAVYGVYAVYKIRQKAKPLIEYVRKKYPEEYAKRNSLRFFEFDVMSSIPFRALVGRINPKDKELSKMSRDLSRYTFVRYLILAGLCILIFYLFDRFITII